MNKLLIIAFTLLFAPLCASEQPVNSNKPMVLPRFAQASLRDLCMHTVSRQVSRSMLTPHVPVIETPQAAVSTTSSLLTRLRSWVYSTKQVVNQPERPSVITLHQCRFLNKELIPDFCTYTAVQLIVSPGPLVAKEKSLKSLLAILEDPEVIKGHQKEYLQAKNFIKELSSFITKINQANKSIKNVDDKQKISINALMEAAIVNNCLPACQCLLLSNIELTNTSYVLNAAQLSTVKILKLLIKANPALINSKNSLGNTPLIGALLFNNKETAWWLINNFADTSIANKELELPIHIACLLGDTDILKELIEKNKTHIEACTRDQGTPILYAYMHGHYQAIQLLMQYRARTDIVDPLGRNILYYAFGLAFERKPNYLLCLEEALKSHTELNGINDQGNTMLHFLATLPDVSDATALLVSKGASYRIPNNFGVTAYDIASPKVRKIFDDHEQNSIKKT